MKFLIAGLGSIGRRHLNNLHALGQHDILLYRTHRSTIPDQDLINIPVETNLEDALTHKPDAVIISNPTSLHMDVAIPAAEAGCHIFLEKPISNTLERVDEFQSIVTRQAIKVFVGFQFRFHPGLMKARQMLLEGAIGRPLSLRAHWGEYLPNWHPWEDYRIGYSARPDLGGGVILSLCHPLDYLRWMVGDVSAIWSFSGKISDLEIQVEDTAEIGLRFQNGVIGSVHLNYTQLPASHRLEIVGTNGTICWNNADGAVQRYQSEKAEWELFPPPSNFERNHLFLSQMQHFLNVVEGKTEPLCTFTDGVKALQLALAAHQSQESGALVRM